MKVKFTMRYPTSLDRTKFQANIDSSIVELAGKRYVDDEGMLVLESDPIDVKDYAYMLKDIPRDGLVLNIPFFEGQGTVARDLVGGNNGSLTNCSWFNHNGRWVVELTDNSRVTIPSASVDPIVNSKEITVTFWIYPTKVEPTYTFFIHNACLIDIEVFKIGTSQPAVFLWVCEKTGTFGCEAWDGTRSGFPLDENSWNFFAMAFDGNSGDFVAFHNTDKQSNENIPCGFCSGYDTYIYGYSYFNYRLAFLRMYDRMLEDSEIMEIYELEKELLRV